jgi:hypothetical protein
MEFLLEILKFTIPALTVFLTTYLLFKSFFEHQAHMKLMELQHGSRTTTLPQRLQAYERLSLFAERISIPNLIMRLRTGSSTNQSLMYAMMMSIQQEYEHNISQQIYIGDQLWQIIKLAKDNMVVSINTCASGLDPNGSSEELINALFNYLAQNPAPNDTALEALRSEASKLF